MGSGSNIMKKIILLIMFVMIFSVARADIDSQIDYYFNMELGNGTNLVIGQPNAVATGGSASVSGIIGNAVRHTATSNPFRIPRFNLSNNITGEPSPTLSLSIWLKRNSSNAGTTRLFYRDNTPSRYSYNYIESDRLYVDIFRSTPTERCRFEINNTNISDNAWHNVVFVKNDDNCLNNSFSIYVDAVSKTEFIWNQSMWINLTHFDKQVGSGAGYDTYYSTPAGKQVAFDEYAVWRNYSLNQSDVDLIYNSGTGRMYPFNSCIWECNGYDACSVIDTKTCNSVIDTNSCGESYTGNYSEFTLSCDYCTPSWSCDGFGICNLFSHNLFSHNCSSVADANSCYSQTNLPSDQYSGDYSEYPSEVCGLTTNYFDDFNDGLCPEWAGADCSNYTLRTSPFEGSPQPTFYYNGFSFENFATTPIIVEFNLSMSSSDFTFGFANVSNGDVVSARINDNAEAIEFYDSDGGWFAEGLCNYGMDYAGEERKVKFFFNTTGYISLYIDNVGVCEVYDANYPTKSLESLTTTFWYDYQYIDNLAVYYLCTPDWSCNGYGTCLINSTQNCNSVTDLNVCGEIYSGDYSEFTSQSCTYVEIWTPQHLSSDIPAVVIDFLVEFGLQIIAFVGLITLGVLYVYVIKKVGK
jgi:hypothetical protein